MKDVYLLDLINGISGALDYVSSTVTGHHRRVGITAAAMASALCLDTDDTADLILASLLHDIGAFSLDLKLDGLDFDTNLTEHSVAGYRLLKGHPLLNRPSQLVLYHHTSWQNLHKLSDNVDQKTFFLANVLNLADRVDVLGKVGTRIFDREHIRNLIGSTSETIYAKDVIATFMNISETSEFWDRMEDTQSPVRDLIGDKFKDRCIPQDQLLGFSRFFPYLIDFRSRHTATHSQGVAETAVQLAKLAGMSEHDQLRMRLAGNLHDIGKLAVPVALLDKPAALDPAEFEIVKNHAKICENVLRPVPGLEDITDWACQHHERINGKGYPHGIKGKTMSLGSRIMAVADVCTAISEDRPYRDGMSRDEARKVLMSMADAGILDLDVVTLALDNYDLIDAVRRMVQSRALVEFKHFRTS